MMKIKYNVTGTERKKLVEVISSATGYEARYLRIPTYGYQVGPYFVSKEGTVEVADDESTIGAVYQAAKDAGFTGIAECDPEIEEEEEEEEMGDSISIPKNGMTPEMVDNLKKIIEAKASLIKKAFGIKRLPVVEEPDKITFYWVQNVNPREMFAYGMFLAALRKMAMETKRVTMTDAPVENEKYAWRCFLLRLGFIGQEYKKARQILMQNFSGSSAFKKAKNEEND